MSHVSQDGTVVLWSSSSCFRYSARFSTSLARRGSLDDMVMDDDDEYDGDKDCNNEEGVHYLVVKQIVVNVLVCIRSLHGFAFCAHTIAPHCKNPLFCYTPI